MDYASGVSRYTANANFDCSYDLDKNLRLAPLTNYSEKKKFLGVAINEREEIVFVTDEYQNRNTSVFEEENNLWGRHNYILKKNERVGIRKGEEGRTDDEAYYKQVFYRFNSDFCMGTYLEIDDAADMDAKVHYTTFGKERLIVRVSFTKCGPGKSAMSPDFSNTVFGVDSKSLKVLLLSETVLKTGYTKAIDLGLTNRKRFGFIKSTVGNESYSGSIYKDSQPSQHNILAAGSILWVKDMTAWQSVINESYSIIGMNSFVTIKEEIDFNSFNNK